jgi:bacteriorhodopsin
MDTKYFFYITLVISIIVQIITGGIEIGAFFIKVPTAYSLIKELLILELTVQLIEGAFYFWLAYNFTKLVNVTPKRYIDWAITTPTMLITLMLYLIYLDKKAKDETNELHFFTLLKDNSGLIIPVLILNWLMLLFGYLGEMKKIPVLLGIFLGFIPFLIYYYMIYVNYVTENPSGYLLFWYFFFFWSLYGVVAVLPYYIKNSFYNILDLFAKNFFGLFLSYIIFSGNYK